MRLWMRIVLLCVAGMALCCGCGYLKGGTAAGREGAGNTETKGEGPMTIQDVRTNNAHLLEDALGIDGDCALGAADTMEEVGIGALVLVERVTGTQYTAKAVSDGGRTYVLEFSQMGYLQVIRSGDGTGMVLYGVVS